LRRYAGAGGIERELADRDAHPAGAEIAETEDTLAVSDDDETHVLFRPIGQQLLQPAARTDRQIDAARLAEDMTEFLARFANGRGIDERHIGCRVRHQDRIVKRLVARLQIRQHEIFLQVVIETGDLVVSTRHLQLDREDRGRQQSFETPGAALRLGKRRAFVEARIVKQLVNR
jgi:hypothetical protein